MGGNTPGINKTVTYGMPPIQISQVPAEICNLPPFSQEESEALRS
jgi:hypothetical protein